MPRTDTISEVSLRKRIDRDARAIRDRCQFLIGYLQNDREAVRELYMIKMRLARLTDEEGYEASIARGGNAQ